MNIQPIVNALTIDVEDYFHVHAFSDVIQRKDWGFYESRVEKNTLRILDLLESHNEPRIQANGDDRKLRATFFILGWVAKRYPALVKDIHSRGHEVACHGYAHQVIFKQTKEEFRKDVKKAKALLEDLIGERVIGYRAPTYSITQETQWSLKVLLDLGFKYDSSIFPIKHDVYGFPEAPRFPFRITFDDKRPINFTNVDSAILTGNTSLTTDNLSIPDSIVEFPMTTTRIWGYNMPISGGGYFRLLPYPIISSFLKKINKREGKPFVFYFHPWEIDPQFPKVPKAGWLSKFRTYINLEKTQYRFEKLLFDFSFTKMADLFSKCVSL